MRRKKWSTAANVAYDHTEIRSHIPDLIRRKVNCEFQEFGSNTILKGRSLEEIAAYNNNLLLKEVQVFCPLWFSALSSACGHTLCQRKARHSTAVNVMALSSQWCEIPRHMPSEPTWTLHVPNKDSYPPKRNGSILRLKGPHLEENY